MPKAHEEYMDTVRRIEPDVHPLDRDGALASIAISQRRIADSLSLLVCIGAILVAENSDATAEEVISDATHMAVDKRL